jgi:hypothetical protein
MHTHLNVPMVDVTKTVLSKAYLQGSWTRAPGVLDKGPSQ